MSRLLIFLSLAHSGRIPLMATVIRKRLQIPTTTHVATTLLVLPEMSALPGRLPIPTMTGTS